MKLIHLLVFTLIINFCCAQNIRFDLRTMNSCDTAAKPAIFYSIKEINGDAIHSADSMFSSVRKLPHKGKYMLIFNYLEPDTVIINIIDTGLTVYKYKEPNILMSCCVSHSPVRYFTCEKPANGFVEDFYPDGPIRQRGNFFKGRIKDTLFRYFHNGKLRTRTIASPTRIDKEEYDILGYKRRKSGYVNPDAMEFYGDDTTLYFNNGQVKIYKMTTDKGYVFIDEYYENGKLKAIQGKNSRIEYSASGIRLAEYNWVEDTQYAGYFDIIKTEFDKNHRKTRKVKYGFSMSDHWAFDYHLFSADFINHDIRYKNGKQESIIKDLDMSKPENKLKYSNQ